MFLTSSTGRGGRGCWWLCRTPGPSRHSGSCKFCLQARWFVHAAVELVDRVAKQFGSLGFGDRSLCRGLRKHFHVRSTQRREHAARQPASPPVDVSAPADSRDAFLHAVSLHGLGRLCAGPDFRIVISHPPRRPSSPSHCATGLRRSTAAWSRTCLCPRSRSAGARLTSTRFAYCRQYPARIDAAVPPVSVDPTGA